MTLRKTAGKIERKLESERKVEDISTFNDMKVVAEVIHVAEQKRIELKGDVKLDKLDFTRMYTIHGYI